MDVLVCTFRWVGHTARKVWNIVLNADRRHVRWVGLFMGILTVYQLLLLCDIVSYGGTNVVQGHGVAPVDSGGLVELVEDTIRKPKRKRIESETVWEDESVKPDDEDDTVETFEPAQTIDTDSLVVYPTLPFNEGTFWDDQLEHRYQDQQRKTTIGPPIKLKIFLTSYSNKESEPTWTPQQAQDAAHAILNTALLKLVKYQTMTFQWTEASTLSSWWTAANDTQRTTLRELVREGRFEIVTGSWTKVEENVASLYTMIDHLIEGHQWLKINLDVSPESSLALDGLGAGPVYPYLLSQAGIHNSVIMRTHSAWKKWFATHRSGDFQWIQRWNQGKGRDHDMLVHQHYCNSYATLGVTEQPAKHVPDCIQLEFSPDKHNPNISMKEMADSFVDQARRTASLVAHNFVLVILGDGRPSFGNGVDWDMSNDHFVRLFDYINEHGTQYNAEVEFGTVNDYFRAIRKSEKRFPGFIGDLPVFNGGESETQGPTGGAPIYWSGHFSSNPYLKKLYRETENIVRNAELLFSFVNMATRQQAQSCFTEKTATEAYKEIQAARRDLAQFAHLDSKMPGLLGLHAMKLKNAQDRAMSTQLIAVNCLTFMSLFGFDESFSTSISSSWRRDEPSGLINPVPLEFTSVLEKRVVLFNNLAWPRAELISIDVVSSESGSTWFEVVGPLRKYIPAQLNPVLEIRENRTSGFSLNVFRLLFLAELQPFSLAVYRIRKVEERSPFSAVISVQQAFYPSLQPKAFQSPTDDDFMEPVYREHNKKKKIVIQNGRLKLTVDPRNGFTYLNTTVRGDDRRTWIDLKLSLGSYKVNEVSQPGIPTLNVSTDERGPFGDTPVAVYIVKGSVAAEIIIVKGNLVQTLRVLHTGEALKNMEDAVYIQNIIIPSGTSGAHFMRLDSNLNSVSQQKVPVFFTDQAGFSFERRIKIGKLGLPGNTYPVTCMAYVQDPAKGFRLSLLVDRAHGASSMEPGRLQVMIGESNMEETFSNYVLLLEDLHPHLNRKSIKYEDTLPTILAHHLSAALSYPAAAFHALTLYKEREISIPPEFSLIPLLTVDLPCDVHLVNFRTLFRSNEGTVLEPDLDQPGLRSLLLVQKLGSSFHNVRPESCETEDGRPIGSRLFFPGTTFTTLFQAASLTITDLAGLGMLNSEPDGTNSTLLLQDIKSEPFEITSILVQYEKDGPELLQPPPSIAQLGQSPELIIPQAINY